MKGDTAWQAAHRPSAWRIPSRKPSLTAEGRAPILNAVAGALVNVEAAMLASVADPRHRKALRHAMERARPRALAEAMTQDNGQAQVINLGALKQ